MASEHKIGSKSKEVGWYDPPTNAAAAASGPVRDLLENYSHYQPDEVIPKIIETRDKIWDVFPWPCVGQFRFLDLSLSRHPMYGRILERIRDGGEQFLDVGCCFAQDIRKLVHDGAPAANLWGLEKQAEFITLAFDFFRDADRLAADHFIHADLLDREHPQARALEGNVDIVQLGMILHVWDRAGQVEACRRVVELLRPRPGSLVIGQSVGHLDGVEMAGAGGKRIFKQNAETFAAMWEEVGRLTGTKWQVHASLDEGLGIAQQQRQWDDPRTRRLSFVVERL
ncbi:9062dc1e-1f17-46de-b7e8-2f327e6c427f [Thermothielavioides terrestris]|uniref:9062dc1e-1f17-46de-b7e8-2f327e6c427f n=1 Tax=Thermothielavioides terrestris TaxID=2587410 RepID=A0A446BCR4_9PEZI|nr:9062dc1e-1f17-46de-b7e8-2f327e6c427f [Thermothielavioides terrestris]